MSGATRRSTSRRTSSSGVCGRCRARASPAPTSRSPTRGPRSPWPTRSARRRGRSAPPTRSASPAARSAPTTPTPQGLLDALPASPAGQAGAGAGRRRRRPRGRLGAGPRGRRGRGLEPHRAALAHLCDELGGDAGRRRRRQAPIELIVNSTAVGLRRRGPVRRAAPRRRGVRRRADRRRPGLRRAAEPLLAAAERPGRRRVDGIEVLVRQGALSLEIWTGREAPLDTMRAARLRQTPALPAPPA